jgi:GTP-binding protein
VLTPTPVDDAGFVVERDPNEPDGFVVRGAKPERWVRQTAFDNDEAVGYLADRLARLGVERQLAAMGARRGAAVTIGDVTFDFEPSAGVDEERYQPTRRGADVRLETRPHRTSAAERLAAERARHGHVGDDG